MCTINGRDFPLNTAFRLGRFQYHCLPLGYVITGCYYNNGVVDELMDVGTELVANHLRHKCFREPGNVVRYTSDGWGISFFSQFFSGRLLVHGRLPCGGRDVGRRRHQVRLRHTWRL